MSHLVLDSVTVFPADARGRAALAASHGGVYAAYLAAKAGVKAVILCDAGVGRERAGIGGLDYLAALGVAAATIGHRSARIGDGTDCFTRGLISHVNSRAAKAGAAPTAIGMPPATTPLAPSMPTEKSAMCIEPPLPRQ